MAAILVPDRTCWRLDRADRASCIQDGADHFRLVRAAMLRAEHSVFILGWDISGRTNLIPGLSESDAPAHLDDLVTFIAKRRPRLQVYILVWDYGSLYTLERDPLTRYRLGWRTPRNVHFGFDDHHPLGGCHHQKVVVVDDALAFSGSIDLTGHRWDRSDHEVDDPDRITPTGKAYDPYHEVQMLVDGPAASALGELCRHRWRVLGARHLPPIQPSTHSLWPIEVKPDFVDPLVGISRTIPGSESEPAVRECEALFFESIAAAKRSIFIENQYFTSARLADALAKRLKESDGPEVIVVSPRECHGWLEKSTMGAFRERAFETLRGADAHGRLRLVHPLASRSRDVSTFIHSKVMTVDDELLRIGSANFSNRSLGMDTECDVSIAADGKSDTRRGIRAVLARLLGEHVGATGAQITRELEQAGSIRGVIDAHAGNERTLEIIPPAPESVELPDALRNAADPEEPIGLGPEMDGLLPAVPASSERSVFRAWVLPATAIASALLVAWASSDPSAPEWLASARRSLSAAEGTAGIVLAAAALVVAAWCLVPIEIGILVTGFALGSGRGAVASAAGAVVAAATMYAAGRLIGPAALARWLSPRAYRKGRQICTRRSGLPAVLRAATVATTSSMHLLCGAGKVRFWSYMAGTVLGLVPAVFALSVLGGLLRWTLFRPTISAALATIGVAVLVTGAGAALRTFLLIRQFAPITAGHRSRAEFG